MKLSMLGLKAKFSSKSTVLIEIVDHSKGLCWSYNIDFRTGEPVQVEETSSSTEEYVPQEFSERVVEQPKEDSSKDESDLSAKEED